MPDRITGRIAGNVDGVFTCPCDAGYSLICSCAGPILWVLDLTALMRRFLCHSQQAPGGQSGCDPKPTRPHAEFVSFGYGFHSISGKHTIRHISLVQTKSSGKEIENAP